MTRKIREERSVNMEGKHFKAVVVDADFYKNRIKQLESELMAANREVQALEDKEEKLNGAIAELKEENEKLRDEIIRRVVGA